MLSHGYGSNCRVFSHYGDLIWTSQWQKKIVFPRYKKINKIKFIKIIGKGTHFFKAIIINLPGMKKSNQNRG
jgi:hypothetical protein